MKNSESNHSKSHYSESNHLGSNDFKSNHFEFQSHSQIVVKDLNSLSLVFGKNVDSNPMNHSNTNHRNERKNADVTHHEKFCANCRSKKNGSAAK